MHPSNRLVAKMCPGVCPGYKKDVDGRIKSIHDMMKCAVNQYEKKPPRQGMPGRFERTQGENLVGSVGHDVDLVVDFLLHQGEQSRLIAAVDAGQQLLPLGDYLLEAADQAFGVLELEFAFAKLDALKSSTDFFSSALGSYTVTPCWGASATASSDCFM